MRHSKVPREEQIRHRSALSDTSSEQNAMDSKAPKRSGDTPCLLAPTGVLTQCQVCALT